MKRRSSPRWGASTGPRAATSRGERSSSARARASCRAGARRSFRRKAPTLAREITFEPTLGGTLVTLLHTDIPVGQGDRYRQSWNEYYLSRMKAYFADNDETTSDFAQARGHEQGSHGSSRSTWTRRPRTSGIRTSMSRLSRRRPSPA